MVLTALSVLVLVIWIGLAATRTPAFRSPPRLRPAKRACKISPGVVAVIPARNEAETIAAVVAAHAAADYEGAFSIVVVDDHSTDETAAIVSKLSPPSGRFATTSPASGGGAERAALSAPPLVGELSAKPTEGAQGARQITLIGAPPLPAGWTGKLSAVHAGLQHANKIAPDAKYVLLTDADIVLSPATLTKLVAHAEVTGAALVSLMARLDARGVWGGLLVPAFVYFFYKLYPFHVANDPSQKLAAAAGGCMLIRRDALDAIGGVNAIRARLIDDCALASAVKKSGRAIWIGVAKDEAISLRDNRSLSSIWSMVARSAFAQLNHSWPLLAGAIAGMIFLYLTAPVIALAYPAHQNAGAAAISAAAWAVTAAAYLPTARIYDQARWKTVFLPLAAFFYTLMTITSAIDHARGKGGAWKGRTYPA